MITFGIFGFGIQGKKRAKILSDLKIKYLVIDPVYVNSDFKRIEQIPLKKLKEITHFIISTPYKERINIIEKIKNLNVNILIEKPAISSLKEKKFFEKNKKILKRIYISYNHLFEDSIKYIKKKIKKNELGKIYFANMRYGNGTAVNIKKSKWKDQKKGVILDLFPQLIDILYFLFGGFPKKYKIQSIRQKYENNSYDYTKIYFSYEKINVCFEVSYLFWKNQFEIFIVGSKGYLKLSGLPKWGKTELEIGKRVFPSGKPKIKIKKFKEEDYTWKKEMIGFIKKEFNSFNLNKEIQQFKITQKC